MDNTLILLSSKLFYYYFADFQQNNGVLMQKSSVFLKYHPQGKCIVQQLVANLLIFNQISYLRGGGEACIQKNISLEKC